tara:strand:- start:226 stop:567 length:342 start_codon:yes stop_codon:yes gene_type:complete
MHFCCNKLVDMAVLGTAQDCKDKVQKKDIPSKNCATFQDIGCCSSEAFVKTGDDTIKMANHELQAQDIVFLNTFFYTYINLFEGLDKNEVPFKHYKPPLLFKDIQTLHQIYLI